jgi:hypothetical protein
LRHSKSFSELKLRDFASFSEFAQEPTDDFILARKSGLFHGSSLLFAAADVKVSNAIVLIGLSHLRDRISPVPCNFSRNPVLAIWLRELIQPSLLRISAESEKILMKRSFVTPLVLAVVVVVPSYSHAVPITSLFNTGTITNGTLLAEGSSDPHYELIESPDVLFPGPQSYVVLSTGHPISNDWLANGPDSQWIGPQSNQDENAGGGNEPGTYIYRTTFDLTGYDPTTAHIAGSWSVDNLGLDILINGASTGYSLPQFGWNSLHEFAIDSGFVSGTNTLDFVLQNQGGPTGLRVEMSGTAFVPEPSGLSLVALGMLVFGVMLPTRVACLPPAASLRARDTKPREM